MLCIYLICVLCFGIVYIYFYKPLHYWKDRNVPQLKTVLFFGNFILLDILLGRVSIQEGVSRIRSQYPGKRCLEGDSRDVIRATKYLVCNEQVTDMLYIFLFCVALIGIVYVYFYKPLCYWKDRNVPALKTILFFGNYIALDILLGRISIQEGCARTRRLFPGKRYIGAITVTKPILEIFDVDLIKDIFVKNYDHFLSHAEAFGEDPLVSRSVAIVSGQFWKDLRCTLSPAFTTGKLKGMYPLINICAKNFVDYYNEKIEDVEILNAKDTFSRYTNDAIASTAFGVTCDSFKNQNNEFYKMGKRLTNSSGTQAIKVILSTSVPSIMKALKIPIFAKDLSDYFKNIIKSSIAYRQEHGIVRLDLIHLLMLARKQELEIDDTDDADELLNMTKDSFTKVNGKHVNLTDDEITAQVLTFYFAGFDTTSALISFLAYELAINPEVQDKLREEILKNSNHIDTLEYEHLLKLKYLNMVVLEALRKWPAAFYYTRECTKDYVIEPKLPGEQPLKLEVGDTVGVCALSLHKDPQFFPDPEKFDPERFSDENKENIVPYSYIPFSVGPRNCIASRLALLKVKIFFVHLLSNFELVPVEKTKIPMTFKKFNVTNDGDGGIWIGLKKYKIANCSGA